MLAHKSILKLTLLALAALVASSGSLVAQQTPSQVYEPVRDSLYQTPPSVHVPPQNAQRLPEYQRPKFKLPKISQAGISPTELPPQTRRGVRANFNDQPKQPTFEGAKVAQASFQEESGEPVPAILLGKASAPQKPVAPADQTILPTQAPPVASTPSNQFSTEAFKPVENKKSPADFQTRINQIRTSTPRIAPVEIRSEQQPLKSNADSIRMEAELKVQAEQTELAEQIEQQRLAKEAELARQQIEQAALQAKQEMGIESKPRQSTLQSQMTQSQPQQSFDNLATKPLRAEPVCQETEFSATDFVKQIRDGGAAASAMAEGAGSTTPDVMSLTEAEELPQASFASQAGQQSQVVPASSTTDAPAASVRLAAPALQVEAYGPESIGINKPATYQIVVRNNNTMEATRVLVGINMPEWVDLENISMTTGEREITDGKNQARLVWSVDRVPGNTTQTITVTAIPRKPEMFDLGVEWTMVPRVGRTSVRVTEPKLEMSIAGPKEVMYGETALYHVTVRNPGTGDAEDVVVMLPEALGGERATLGDIGAGKEKNFQVELLARTAGDLNLVATAAAEGNLKASSERSLVVRRANLEVSMKGPGLKYAGSVGQYMIEITNDGDATATDIVSAVALPQGVKYLSGIEGVKLIEGGMRWPVGSLDPGQTRTYKINCQLDTSGDLQLEVGARGKGELAASSACLTTVETVADLVLTVSDPKGPLPTGQEVPYQIHIRNRGSKAAKGVNLVMQFSDGIEPRDAKGLEHRLVPGQVFFSPIEKINPGQEMTFEVAAEALKSGTHVFRAQLTCEDSDAREVAEGTTRFFGDEIQSPTTRSASAPGANDFGGGIGTEFKR